jgi:hypothetical protein
MKSRYHPYKTKVVNLRKKGRTYTEIRQIVGFEIPKSTLSYWCRNIYLPLEYKRKIKERAKLNLDKARQIALAVNRVKREKYIQEVENRVKYLRIKLRDRDVARIALAMLFLGEGSKTARGYIMFGNSDPATIKLFLRLLRYCYKINENRFRCTLQCRADQKIKTLEKFWSQATKIPPSQFYKAKVDPRTVGRVSKKPDYKGVCRIDYFSGDIFMELKQIIGVITKGL